jgi:hypothetical protein
VPDPLLQLLERTSRRLKNTLRLPDNRFALIDISGYHAHEKSEINHPQSRGVNELNLQAAGYST